MFEIDTVWLNKSLINW